jgi:hypothetical protein
MPKATEADKAACEAPQRNIIKFGRKPAHLANHHRVPFRPLQREQLHRDRQGALNEATPTTVHADRPPRDHAQQNRALISDEH